jgi:hypothetical protein
VRVTTRAVGSMVQIECPSLIDWLKRDLVDDFFPWHQAQEALMTQHCPMSPALVSSRRCVVAGRRRAGAVRMAVLSGSCGVQEDDVRKGAGPRLLVLAVRPYLPARCARRRDFYQILRCLAQIKPRQRIGNV